MCCYFLRILTFANLAGAFSSCPLVVRSLDVWPKGWAPPTYSNAASKCDHLAFS